MHRSAALSFLLFAFLIAPNASAQGRVTGTVKNADGHPVKGAIVTAENPDASASDFKTTTNAKGKYAFLGLRGGAWTLTAEAPGFRAAERRMDVRMLGDNAAVDFQLHAATDHSFGPTAGIDSAAVQQRLAAAANLERGGKFDEAIAAYRDVLTRVPALTSVHLQLGVLFERKGDVANAIAEYGSALKADPADAKARAGLERLSRR